MSDCCATPPASTGDRRIGPFAEVTKGFPEASALRSAGFAILRHGQPATAEQLARSTGLGIRQVYAAIVAMADRGVAELDGHDRWSAAVV